MIVALIVGVLSLVAIAYGVYLVRAALAAHQFGARMEAVALGAITNFFDTLGIGSFAPSIAWMRLRKLVPDRLIPMTMLSGYILPSLLQGIIFMLLLGVKVDPNLILGCVVAMIIGGIISPDLANRAPIRMVQGIVGVSLLVAAFFYSLSNLGLMPAGGTATSLPPMQALVAIAAHFLFGILLAFGVGNYAPTLALLSLMGMDPRFAFPIMATAAGLSGSAAAARSLNLMSIDLRISLGLAAGAIPAVLVAAFLVKEMPVDVLRWLVVVVVTYAAVTLLVSALSKTDLVPDDAAETAATHQ
jgi:uncharacterized membrane protein YfcA